MIKRLFSRSKPSTTTQAPTPDKTPYEIIGGEAPTRAIANRFYDIMASDEYAKQLYDMLKLIPNVKLDVVERCAGHGGTFGVMKDTHDLANKVGRPTARQIKNKNNKYMASDCPLAGKHLKQLEVDTNISNDEALHPIELMAKSYRL